MKFQIVSVSSEETGHEVSELLMAKFNSPGWESTRFPIYPQKIIFRLEKPSFIEHLQILSHQFKISTKVEVHTSMPKNEVNLNDLEFKKIGYFTLGSNESSNFQCRELKTIYLNLPALYLKLVFREPYVNSLNTYGQVGLIALQMEGRFLDGIDVQQGKQIDLGQKMKYDDKTMMLLKKLMKRKRYAIDNEDYQEAKIIQEKIKSLEQIGEQLSLLEERKKQAVQQDDFDSAIALSEQIKDLMRRLNFRENE